MSARSSAVLIVVGAVPMWRGRYVLRDRSGCMRQSRQARFPISGPSRRSMHRVAVAVTIGSCDVSGAGMYPPSTEIKIGD